MVALNDSDAVGAERLAQRAYSEITSRAGARTPQSIDRTARRVVSVSIGECWYGRYGLRHRRCGDRTDRVLLVEEPAVQCVLLLSDVVAVGAGDVSREIY